MGDETVMVLQEASQVVGALGDNATTIGVALGAIATGVAGTKRFGGQRFKTLIASLPVVATTVRQAGVLGDLWKQVCEAVAQIVDTVHGAATESQKE